MNSWIVQFDRKESLLIKWFRILGIIGSLGCVFLAFLNNVQFNLWILPVTYSLGMILLGNNNVVEFTPGIIVLNIVMFCRYLILPTVMSINSSELSVYAIQYDQMDAAVFIMWLELIGIWVAIYFTGDSFKKKSSKVLSLEKLLHFDEIKYGDLISIGGIVFIVVLIIRYPHLIGGIELLTQGYLSNTMDISDISGVIGILWKSWTTWIGIYYLYVLKKLNLKGKVLTVFLLFGIVLFVLISFIGQVTISRWYSIVTFCAMYFSVIKMFPDKKKSITRWIMIPAVLFLFVTSIYKNTEYLKAEAGILTYVKELFDVSVLNAYFSGPVNVNNAIHMKEFGNIGFSSIFYDLLRNFPVLNHYIDVSKSTVGAYELYLGRGDQIIPLVGQSVIYFGYLFAPFISIVSVILVRHYDYQYLKSTSLSMYMYAFIAGWIGLITILNFTICVSWFYSIIIPTFLLINFLEILGMRKVKKTLLFEE